MVANETASSSWLWRLFAQGGLLDANSWLWFPARAIFFEPSSVILTLFTSLGLSWLVIKTGYQLFLQGFQQAIPSRITSSQAKQLSKNRFYNTNLYYILLVKEWRLMWRDPNFVLQILLLAFYFIVIILVIQQSEYFSYSGNFSIVLTPLATVISGTLANKLIHFCISNEKAPDLLSASPVNSSKLLIFKVLAALFPTWLLTVPIFVMLIVYATPWLNTLLVILGSTLCSTLLGVWNNHPLTANNSFKTRQIKPNNLMLKLLELISLIAWAALAYSISSHQLVWACTSGMLILFILSVSYGIRTGVDY